MSFPCSLSKLLWINVNYKLNTDMPKLHDAVQFAMAPIQEST